MKRGANTKPTPAMAQRRILELPSAVQQALHQLYTETKPLALGDAHHVSIDLIDGVRRDHPWVKDTPWWRAINLLRHAGWLVTRQHEKDGPYIRSWATALIREQFGLGSNVTELHAPETAPGLQAVHAA